MEDTHEKVQEASAQAVHKAKNHAQAVETARELQLAELVEKTAKATKQSLLEGLQEVFGDGDAQNPQQMKILVQRIPILCTSVLQMHQDLKAMKDNQTWAVRIIIGLFIAGLAKLVFIH